MNFQVLYQKAPITLLFILSFVGFMLYQLTQGVSLDNPSSKDLISFGANFLPLTLMGEPWRLLQSVFLHIGLIHLLFNGFAMYYFGQVVEQIIGKSSFLLVFLLSAVGGNLLNLFITWQGVLNGGVVGLSAGASGGIMGLGAFLLMLAGLKTPTVFILNTKNLAMVMTLNLIMGFAIAGIDNAAHIGGMLVGLCLGLVMSLVLKNRLSKMMFWVVSTLLVLGFVLTWWHLHTQLLMYVGGVGLV
ncbi:MULTISPECIES: rhomboid family intramembrane serine protease [unclassified Moraxella]|uniref:rhomboid family intramembrane serine protease n=1 Tax=unclassified Moraxella TaxID=2685852 RepID=UPI002B4023C6|nr:MULTISPECIES: rhomboid family intramembrane serine protease [unclassified Moraxella]